MKLKHLGGSGYQTLDGRFTIERQDGVTECSHPLCYELHERFGSRDLNGTHWVSYVQWHVWDNEKDDYAGNGPEAIEFETKRDAVQWLTNYLEATDAQSKNT